MFELFLLKLPSKFQPEADAHMGNIRGKSLALQKDRGEGCWAVAGPTAWAARDLCVYRAQGASERASTACILNQELRLPTEKDIFITLLLES